MSLKVKALPLAVAQLVASGAFSVLAVSPVGAQTSVTSIDKINVTGTNIRRADAETASEVQVITREQMIQSGYSSVSEVLRNLTANNNGTLSTGFARAFAAGASGVSLRGLSVGATLILVDGYRMAGYPRSDDAQRQFVDISSIPFVAVERIEVLLDGASAIYGSDAIAGVVNIILKKDFKGTYLNAQGGTTTKGGGTTWNAQFQQGFGDVSRGFGGYAALEYRSQESIQLSQRGGEPWNVVDYSPWGGNNLTPGARSAPVANPVTRTPYLTNPAGATTAAGNAFLDPNCDFARRNASQCTYDNTWSQIQPRSQNVNAILSLSGDIANNWLWDVKASYFDKQASQVFAPGTVTFGIVRRRPHRWSEPGAAHWPEPHPRFHGSGELSRQSVWRAREYPSHLSHRWHEPFNHARTSVRAASWRRWPGRRGAGTSTPRRVTRRSPTRLPMTAGSPGATCISR